MRIPFLAIVIFFLALSSSGAQKAYEDPYPSLPGDNELASFPENDDVRTLYKDKVLFAPTGSALNFRSVKVLGRSGTVLVETVRKGDFFYALFVNERKGGFPEYGQGSFIVKRSIRDGKFVQAKVFLRSDRGLFARIYPAGDRSRIDVVAYGGIVGKEAILPLPFERIILLPFGKIVAYCSSVVDWSLFSPDPGLYGRSMRIADRIRALLPSLEYGPDGAIDEKGSYVPIATQSPPNSKAVLNCSGFAKWLVDGFYKPLTGTLTSIGDLRRRNPLTEVSSFAEPFADSLDLFFGLDWTRNLAFAMLSAQFPGRRPLQSEAEVSLSPFALTTDYLEQASGAAQNEEYPDYSPNSGYMISGLKAMLYLLAMKEPGHFYLGAFNKEFKAGETRLRHYYHVAAFFPYFMPGGEFVVAVFESCEETSIEAVMKRAGSQFIHLSRIKLEEDFTPP